MQQLDYFSFFIAFGVINISIVLVFLFYISTSKPKAWFIYLFFGQKVLETLVLSGIALRNQIPDFISIELSYPLLFCSHALQIICIVSFRGKLNHTFLRNIIVVVALGIILFLLNKHHESTRVIVQVVFNVILFTYGALYLLINRKPYKTPVLIAIAYFAFAAISLARLIEIGYFKFDTYHPTLRTSTDIIALLVVIFVQISVAIGFLLLLNEVQEKLIIYKNEKLADVNATKDRFFNIIAHDLMNPFHAILGITELMNNHSAALSQEEKDEYIKLLHHTSVNTHALLDNLLTWARSQSGIMQKQLEIIVLKDLVDEVLMLIEDSAKAKHIKVSNEVDATITIYADKNMTATILRNLATNALKYSNNDGTIKVMAIPRGGKIEINVVDTGIGMNEELRQNLFILSKTKSLPGTGGETGTGLGLVLCKEFVELHGGKIWVESTPGTGSAFCFTLPAHG